jgi:hypothetical protein
MEAILSEDDGRADVFYFWYSTKNSGSARSDQKHVTE